MVQVHSAICSDRVTIYAQILDCYILRASVWAIQYSDIKHAKSNGLTRGLSYSLCRIQKTKWIMEVNRYDNCNLIVTTVSLPNVFAVDFMWLNAAISNGVGTGCYSCIWDIWMGQQMSSAPCIPPDIHDLLRVMPHVRIDCVEYTSCRISCWTLLTPF